MLIIGFVVPFFSLTKMQESSVQNIAAALPIVFEQKWNYTVTGTYISGTPTLFDIYEDGTKEIVFGTGNQGVYCIDHEGNYNWSYSINSPVRGSPTIVDIDFDGKPNIIVGISDRVRFLDYDGSYMRYTSTGYVMDSPTAVDFEGDGVWEFLTPSYSFYDGIYCINSNGQIRWSYTDISTPGTPDRVYRSPTVCDLDGDEVLEVLFSSWDGKVYCLNETGDFQWSASLGEGQIWGSPIVADVDGDTYIEIIAASTTGDVYCLTYDGGTLWHTNVAHPVYTSPIIGDLDIDGQYEVYIADDGASGVSTSALYSFNGIDGTLNWFYNGSGGFSHAPAIADIDGDGFEEIVMVTSGGTDPALVSVVTSDGALKASLEYTLDGWATSSPVIADIDNDNYMEIIIGDGSGIIYCLGVENAPAGTGTQWYTLGGSFFRNGHPDRDQDYLDEFTEATLGIDETDNDCDSDQLLDGIELFIHHTDPLDEDTDDDTVNDYDEVYFGTDPTKPDSDYDGLSDRFELDYGTDPWNPDTDGDELLDGEEWYTYGSNPLLSDTDGDGLDDWEEVNLGDDGYITSVTDNDTDDDSLLDGEEVTLYGTNPIDADTDDDTILDGEEVIAGDDGYITNATNPDTDGDSYDDNVEIAEGTDPTDPNDNPATETPTPTPTPTNTTTPTNEGALFGGFITLGIVLVTAFSIIALAKQRKKYFK